MRNVFILLFISVVCHAQEQFMGYTLTGGQNNAGTIFLINNDGSDFKIVHHMNPSTDGAENWGSPFLSDDGYCYGMANSGGSFNFGTIFRIKANGTDFSVIKHLNKVGLEGVSPAGSDLIQGSQGFYYSMSNGGGEHDAGVIFRIKGDGTEYETLRSFSKENEGGNPQGSLLLNTNGLLYGMTQFGSPASPASGGSVFKIDSDGNNFETIKDFVLTTPGIAYSYGSLIIGPNAKLFGMTKAGSDVVSPTKRGAIFSINPDGSDFQVIHYFETQDGGQPYGSLILALDDYMYGMTLGNGSFNAGTIFKVNFDGSEFTVIKNFELALDGGYPRGSLTEGEHDELYGITYDGGLFNGGTIFKIKKDGTNFEVLKHLTPETEGAKGRGHLIKIKNVITSAQKEFQNKIGIYPNPSSGFVHVIAPTQSTITIYDSLGKEIGFYKHLTEDNFLDLSNLVKGYYLIKVNSRNGFKIQKLILQ